MSSWLLLALVALPSPCAAAPLKTVPLWHEWYVVTRAGKAVSAFEETAEKRPADSQVAVTQKWVERLDGGKSEAYIGSVSTDDNYSPVAFFVERTGQKSYKIDGRAKGRKLDVTFKPSAGAKKAKATASAQLAPGTYLSNFLSLAVSRHLAEKGAFQFTAVVEDNGDMDVEVKNGIVEIQGTAKQIGTETCHEALIRIDGAIQEWWITKEGKTFLVSFPDSNTRLERSTEAQARKVMSSP